MDDFIIADDDIVVPDNTSNITVTNDTLNNVDGMDEYAFRELSDTQKTILAILPIPSALLSIFGSSVIIYMAYIARKSKSWTPYNRLLVAMSVYDIITSFALGIAAFLNPMETSKKALAFGNDSTCSLIGFFNQISYSGTLYNAALSYYFLCTARFRLKSETIAKWVEPFMHAISIGFPLITGIVGLVLGVYHEPEVGLGCWVNRYPDLCGYGPDGTGEPCLSGMISWIFGGWIAFFTLFSLAINNFVIWVFVRRRINKPFNVVISREDDDTGNISLVSSLRTGQVGSGNAISNTSTRSAGSGMPEELRRAQQKRMRLVSSQAFLFVMSFVVSSLATYILRLFESIATTYVWEMELPYNNYVLMILQAILLPLQGLFNMMVYIRPKLLRIRSDFPRESRMWAIRRAIWGAEIEPSHSIHGEIDIRHGGAGGAGANNPHQQALEKDMVSSLTNGSGTAREEDSNEEAAASRPTPSFQRKASRSNSLEILSDVAEERSGDFSISEHDGGQQNVERRMSGSVRILMDGSIRTGDACELISSKPS